MKKSILTNIISLYGFSIAKLIFPLLTLPYLMRVLSVDCYGVISYVKSINVYMQLIVDFGFILSGTKEIALKNKKNENINKLTGDILLARIILGSFAFIALLIISFVIPILSRNRIYTLLNFIPIFLSIFLFDYVFRGIEKMNVITSRFLIMKSISTLLTFFVIKSDTDIYWIPILDTLGSLAAIFSVYIQLKKYNISPIISSIRDSLQEIKMSFIYFVSSAASTVYSALNTLLIGIYLSESDIAYWNTCILIISAIQQMYSPIIDGIYPNMIKSRNINIIKRVLNIFMPIIISGCIFTYFISEKALLIIGGEKYISCTNILRMLIPVLLFSFPGMLIGWPTLGAIGETKAVTFTTITTSIFQMVCFIILGVTGNFNLISIAFVRSITEFVLFILRLIITIRKRESFEYEKNY